MDSSVVSKTDRLGRRTGPRRKYLVTEKLRILEETRRREHRSRKWLERMGSTPTSSSVGADLRSGAYRDRVRRRHPHAAAGRGGRVALEACAQGSAPPMIALPAGVKVWLAAGATDMRKGFDRN